MPLTFQQLKVLFAASDRPQQLDYLWDWTQKSWITRAQIQELGEVLKPLHVSHTYVPNDWEIQQR